MPAPDGKKLVSDLARELCAFVGRELPAKYLREPFFHELESGPWIPSEFARLALPSDEVLGAGHSAQAIAHSQPPPLDPAQQEEACEIVNRAISWTTAWTQLVVPDLQIIRDAVAEARRRRYPRCKSPCRGNPTKNERALTRRPFHNSRRS
jgi:hypothetical protein